MAPPSPESHLLPVNDQPISDTTTSSEESQQLQEGTHSPETISHDPNSEILELLREIRNEQKSYFTLRRERWNDPFQLSQITQRLWESRDDAWAGVPPQKRDLYKDRDIGHAFLGSLLPLPGNFFIARQNITNWTAMPDDNKHRDRSVVWNEDFLVGPLTRNKHFGISIEWPATATHFPLHYGHNSEAHCYNLVRLAIAQRNSREPFKFDVPKEPWKELSTSGKACGVIVNIIVIQKEITCIDFGTAAGALCFIADDHQSVRGSANFLNAHVAKWQLSPTFVRGHRTHHDTTPWAGSELEFRSNTVMHSMRSFIVLEPHELTRYKNSTTPGLRCYREYVTFRGLYDDNSSKPCVLKERRHSIGLAMLPFQRPAGHFCLVHIRDQTLNGEPVPKYENRWREYGLRPAGLYSALSVFQLEICACIDMWEADWTHTIRCLDDKVTLKFNILEDDQRLRKLVFDNTADASVLYFKVIQFLNLFSDIVRDAPISLENLSKNWSLSHNWWFQESYPHMEETLQIIESNWDTVKKRQQEASARILEKLQRTTNEVKSLQNGLFNVQSITEAQRSFLEAQKSRTLNKYLMVFTIVTIIFLPPTFVATFFGMDVFQSDTEGDTKRSFWTVLGALSGVTYLLAALGLFGSNLSAEERKAWKETTTLWREGAKLRWNGLWSSRHRSGESKTPQTEV